MPQQSMPEFVAQLERVGQLVCVTGEKRPDELPSIKDAAHDEAVLVEKARDHDFRSSFGNSTPSLLIRWERRRLRRRRCRRRNSRSA